MAPTTHGSRQEVASSQDETFRQLTQDVLNIWNEREPDKTLHDALSRLLVDLTAQIFDDQPVSAAISIHDERRDRLRVEEAVGPMADDILRSQPRKNGLTDYVYRSRRPFITSSGNGWPNEVPTLRLEVQKSKAMQSIAMFPLLFGRGEEEEAIGVLLIASPDHLTVNSEQIAAATLFADRAAFIAQTARVHRRKLREEQAVAQISRFAAEGNPETVAKVIARQAVTLTKSAYAVVFSSSGDRERLSSMGLATEQGEAPRGSEITLDLTAPSINTHVYNTRASYYAPKLKKEPLYYHYGSWDEGTASAYCVPLKTAEETVVGTLYVANNRPEGFSPHDRDFIDILAFHAAAALRSTSLLSNVVRFQLAISDVLSVEAQFTQIREELRRTGLDTSGLFIATYNHQSQLIHFPKVRHRNQLLADDDPRRKPGALYAMRHLNVRNGLVDWVINNRAPLLVKDFDLWCDQQDAGDQQNTCEQQENEGPIDEHGDLRCCLVVPMYSQDQIVGALGLRSYTETGLFNEYDLQFLEVVANHIAVVIENAARYSKEVLQLDFQLKVAELQEKVADTLRVPQQMTQIRVELQQLGIDINGLFIATFEEESQLIKLPKVYEKGVLITEEEKVQGAQYGPRKLGAQMGLIDWCILNNPQPLHVPDFQAWEHRHEIDPLFSEDLKCFLMAPMYRDKTLIGVIGLRGYAKPGMFDESHSRLLAGVADFLAIIVENAQILETSQRAVEAYNEKLQRQLLLWQALSSFQQEISDINPSAEEVEDIWRCAQSSLREVGVDPSYLYLALCDEGNVTFPRVFEAGKAVSKNGTQRPSQPYRDRILGERPDLTEWIIKHGKQLHFANRADMKAFQTDHDDVDFIPEFSRSWIGVPIKKGDHVFGMLALRSFNQDNAFDELLEEFMFSIASQAAIVLDNARLFDESKSQARYNHALAQAGRSIASAGLEIDRVLETILRQAVEVTEARFGTLQLVQGDTLDIAAIWPAEMRSTVQKHMAQIPITGKGITARAVREEEAQLVHNVNQEDDYIPILPDIRSGLAVVLRGVGENRGKVIGVINVEHEAPQGLTENHRALLVSLSRSAAVAIDYADQYQALERARDIGLASTAIAWLGLFGADWQHTINQKAFGISNYVAGLKHYLNEIEGNSSQGNSSQGSTPQGSTPNDREALNVFTELIPLLHEGLDRIKDVVDEIREVEFTQEVQLPPSITETLVMDKGAGQATRTTSGSAVIDQELLQIVALWCRNHAHIELKFDLDCADTQVGIAPQWLKVALEKLVSNAIKAMPSGGVLTIRTRHQQENAAISIHDTGPGIPVHIQKYFLKRVIPKNIKAIVDPEQNPEEKPANPEQGREGSGMGAMIARFVALSHGGDLIWRNEWPDSGTELVLTLPTLVRPTNEEA